MTDINTLLVLVYAKWCGHCIRYLNLDNKSDKSLWKEICKILKSCKELTESDIKLDTIDFEEKHLKSLINSDKKSLAEMGINYDIDFKKLNNVVEFYPTLIVLIKDNNGVFRQVNNIFNNDKENAKELITYILDSKKQLKGDAIKGGAINLDYRKKYKKYKKLYLELLNKKK